MEYFVIVSFSVEFRVSNTFEINFVTKNFSVSFIFDSKSNLYLHILLKHLEGVESKLHSLLNSAQSRLH
jgi:hypothetical protein